MAPLGLDIKLGREIETSKVSGSNRNRCIYEEILAKLFHLMYKGGLEQSCQQAGITLPGTFTDFSVYCAIHIHHSFESHLVDHPL